MAVNKLDPKIIFASTAPAQDVPAVFPNKTNGWGESRKNGGRPTIKQMNALQQETDLKILWLNENAVAPYDETIGYPNNAVVIKDGTFKILDEGVWKDFVSRDVVSKLKTIPTYYNAEAGVDIVTGVAEGSYYNVRSSSDESYADEYQNVGGVPTPTGKSYPSSNGVESIADLIAIPNPKNGNRVYVKSYYKPTNFALAQPFKGGGVFSYVASRSADNDGVTVFNGWVRQYEYLDLYMAGAKGNGVADDTAAVQRAVDHAQQNNIAINALEGTYLVDEVNVASTNATTFPLNMTGSGWWATVFEARTAGQRSIFNLSGDGITTLSQFHTFSHFKLMGRVRAQVGFYSLCAPHITLEHIYSMGFSEWGLFYLKESWSVNIRSCRSAYNSKHGGYIGSNANGMNIDGCFFFICEGWGLVIDGGLSVNIRGSGIERNKSGGIYANFARNLNIIDTYFELNAENGAVLSPYQGVVAPDITVKTNILLNGTIGFENHGDKYLALPEGDASDYKCKSVRIAGASLQTTFDDVSLVDVIATNGLSVSDVVSLGPKKDTAIGVRIFASASRTFAKDVDIDRMIGFNFPLVGFNNSPVVISAWQDGYNSIKFGRQYNLINPDLTQLVDLRYATTGPVLAITDANKYYKGRKVFTVESSAVSENRTRGKGWIINAADAEWAEFRGKSVYVTCLAKVYGNARLETYYNKDVENNFVPPLTEAQSNTWYQRRTITIKFPETGTLEFGFYMSNILNIETDYAEVSQLVVAPVGVDSRDL